MIRILLVDDHAVVRTGYRRLLDAEPDLKVVAEAATADEAYARVCEQALDVAVVDLGLPGASGLEAIRRMLGREPGLRVLVFSMYNNPSFATQAMRLGAVGYLTKSSEPGEMIEAIREVSCGRRVLSPEIAQILARGLLDQYNGLDCLTPREFEVLRLSARGDSVSSVAGRMHLSPKTIVNYLSMIRQKLQVENDFELLHLAARHGLVELDDGATRPLPRKDAGALCQSRGF